ncbi:hypothetical protein MYSTI_01536 [Myxococcus stipitatus DSM 14675]|uniref:Uncharacterized protein n=1 Tax=Myxococcus stipitatus (strain DSM 14675 / JCM 12634 / Mx s8) TaxID=1278073 RepID=L7U263_MYXSD|nr:hypothetical protein MYSTI_01536 [Myxococcus stipitatus DSM 14675]
MVEKALDRFIANHKTRTGKQPPAKAVEEFRQVLAEMPGLDSVAESVVGEVSRHGGRQMAWDLVGAGVLISAAVNVFAAYVWEAFRGYAPLLGGLFFASGAAIYFRERLSSRLVGKWRTGVVVLLVLSVFLGASWVIWGRWQAHLATDQKSGGHARDVRTSENTRAPSPEDVTELDGGVDGGVVQSPKSN